MTRVAFVLLVPYAYVGGDAEQNTVLSNFFRLFEAEWSALQTKDHSVHIIIQPNLDMSNNNNFCLNKKNDKGKWVPLAEVNQLDPSNGYNLRYEVVRVFSEGKNKRVNGTKLESGKMVCWKQGPKESYKFTESMSDEFYLQEKLDNMGKLSKPLARCQRLQSDHVNSKHNWKVLEVFQEGVGKRVGNNRVKLGLGVRGEQEIKWIGNPKKFVFQRKQEAEEPEHTEMEKWGKRFCGRVTVLPLLRWWSMKDTPQRKVQYGLFRNTLLHHDSTVKILNNLATQNIVYAHIFDPDVVSLRVKVNSQPTLLFTAYHTEILKAHGGELPAILSTLFSFEENEDNADINRLFSLSTELNKKLHSCLPGAGYFSECNTLLRYKESYWKDLKFSPDNNEIIPIVKQLSKPKPERVMFIDGPIITTMPQRMKDWKMRMQENVVSSIVGEGGDNFFHQLETCSQVPLKPMLWSRRIISAIPPYSKDKLNKIRTLLSNLWTFYSPTYSYRSKTNKCTSFYAFVHGGYKEHIEANYADLNEILAHLKKVSETKEGQSSKDNLWDKVNTAAKNCGEVCIAHFRCWINAKLSAHIKSCLTLTARWTEYSLQIADQDILQKLQQHGENNSATPFHFFDVGCGPGVLSFEFVHQYRNALKDIRITASDFSHGMVQHGKDSFKSDSTLSPFSDMSGTLQCDRMVLEEVANASVDIIGSNFGGSNRAIGYAAAYRILKKDGLLFITVWSDTCLQMVWLDKITGMFNSAQVGQDSMSYPSLSFGTDRDKCVKELGEAGFTDVKSYCTTCTILFNDLEQVMIELIEKESQQNVYSDVEAKMNITDPLPDGGPRLIPFTGFTVIARK